MCPIINSINKEGFCDKNHLCTLHIVRERTFLSSAGEATRKVVLCGVASVVRFSEPIPPRFGEHAQKFPNLVRDA